MEPILELATRVTSHIWFLHRLFLDKRNLSELPTDFPSQLPLRWKDDIALNNFSSLQNLLDLAGVRADWPRDMDWHLTWNAVQPGAEKVEGPNRFLPLKALKAWGSRLYDASRNRLPNDDPGREEIENKRRIALDTIKTRLTILRGHLTVPDADDPLRPKRLELSLIPHGPESHRESLTREELFESVVETLLKLPVTQRVAIAKSFMSSAGDGKDGEFYIEQEIRQAVHEDRRATSAARELATGREKLPPVARGWFEGDWRSKLAERFTLLLDPPVFRDFCVDLGVPVPFSMTFRDELDEIARLRINRLWEEKLTENDSSLRSKAGVSDEPGTVQRQAFNSHLFGLALSGGGIRSATFALGLLEGMADRNILPCIDVLSTVSGGGYIGSWLISWIKRRGNVKAVQESLCGNATDRCRAKSKDPPGPNPFGFVSRNVDPEADHFRPVRLLREYARYLAPRAGFFSADSWTIFATWARNTLLNFLILFALLGTLLLVPRIATSLLLHFRAGACLLITAAGLFLWSGCLAIGWRNLRYFGPVSGRRGEHLRGSTRGDGDHGVVGWTLPFIVVAAYLEVAAVWFSPVSGVSADSGSLFLGLLVLPGVLILIWSSSSWASSKTFGVEKQPGVLVPILLALLGSFGAAWGLARLFYYLGDVVQRDTERGIWIAVGVGIPLVLIAFSLIVVVFIGLLGNALSDEQREWWSRMGAWLSLVILGWLVGSAISFFAPLWLSVLSLKLATLGIGGWTAITGWGTKLAYSPKSGRNGGDTDTNPVEKLVLKLAPGVFIIGLLSLVSLLMFWGVGWVLYLTSGWSSSPEIVGAPVSRFLYGPEAEFSFARTVHYYWTLMYAGSLAPFVLIVALGCICLLFAWRVDINQFSMHRFYRNRLVRCYMGASRERLHRAPNAFTGFDPEDDIRMARFQTADPSLAYDTEIDCKPSYAGPFPVVNTTLNVTEGADLGLQERKGESFSFTPLWSGFDYSRRQAAVKKTNLMQYGYRRTAEFGAPQNGGIFLGTAMAISGAAFNSNMGFQTSPGLAFLLTVFGVRLGWWAGNPRCKTWRLPSPLIALWYLVREMTASTRTDSPFVLLSDGGHFENMGLYELIRRRCRYIIVCDAEEDAHFKLEGIGGAIRKCRVDFGVAIDLNLDALQPIGDPANSRLHYSMGTVLYPEQRECARLVYIKSSVTGDEPVDVAEFRKRHKEFPHTSTADQFFDESHFESYRALGQHVAQDVFLHDIPLVTDADDLRKRVSTLFKLIESDWKQRLAASEKNGKKENKNAQRQ